MIRWKFEKSSFSLLFFPGDHYTYQSFMGEIHLSPIQGRVMFVNMHNDALQTRRNSLITSNNSNNVDGALVTQVRKIHGFVLAHTHQTENGISSPEWWRWSLNIPRTRYSVVRIPWERDNDAVCSKSTLHLRGHGMLIWWIRSGWQETTFSRKGIVHWAETYYCDIAWHQICGSRREGSVTHERRRTHMQWVCQVIKHDMTMERQYVLEQKMTTTRLIQSRLIQSKDDDEHSDTWHTSDASARTAYALGASVTHKKKEREWQRYSKTKKGLVRHMTRFLNFNKTLSLNINQGFFLIPVMVFIDIWNDLIKLWISHN